MKSVFSGLKSLSFVFIFSCLSQFVFSQGFYEEDKKFNWKSNEPVKLPANYAAFENAGLVILDDKTAFTFYINELMFTAPNLDYYGRSSAAYQYYKMLTDYGKQGKIVRDITFKINSAKALSDIISLKLPESFDQAYETGLYKQGRQARISIPDLKDYNVSVFKVRRFTGKWSDIQVSDKYDMVRWIKPGGEFATENVHCFELKDLHVGDIVELHYEATFKSDYGNNLFYFNSRFPKLQCEYDFTYRINKAYSSYSYVLPVNISSSLVTTSYSLSTDNVTQYYKIRLNDLPGINYPANSFEGGTLPHVYADFNFRRIVTGSMPDVSGRQYDFALIRPKHFEWLFFKDTVNHYTRIYDKHFATLRKFAATLPKPGSDSANYRFFKALCDTFNAFRHLSSNQLFYNEKQLYAVSSDDHLLKRRIAGDSLGLYRDILNDNSIFYYLLNVQDKRYGEHNAFYRAHYAYENVLFALPLNNSFFYFMPRYDGVKYHLGELPFYYEGSLASLKPENFQPETKNKDAAFFKYIKTRKSTFNDNTRTENATVKIFPDKQEAVLMTKESLSGQFSTVLRHLYLNEYIDSTISPFYFKRSTDKPGASDVKIKLSSHMKDYPFRYTFNCSQKVRMQSSKQLDLTDWFSFPLSKTILPEKPTHDYYMDFEFSDSYNFMLDFDAAVELKNAAAFSKKINNELFELESEIVKNSDTNYLLRVRLAIKQQKILLDQLDALMQLVGALDELNSFSLELARK